MFRHIACTGTAVRQSYCRLEYSLGLPMAKTIIIGGGAIGLSLAYHLARRGTGDLVLLERNQLTSGTSWHAAGIVGPLRATLNMTKLAIYARTLFPRLEDETGLATGYRKTGGYWLARREERMDELHRIAALGRYVGLTASLVSGEEVARDVPGLELAGICGALKVEEDAQVNPVDLCMAYARAAKALGVDIRETSPVSEIVVRDRSVKGVRLASGEELAADLVALCCGAWSKTLTDAIDVSLPLQAVEHMYVVTEPIPEFPAPYPVLRDLDRSIYVKGDAGRLVIGGFERNAKPWDPCGPEADRPFLELPEDWDQFTPFMEAALALIPRLERTGIQHFMNGPESFTADTRPLIGETPEVDGLFVAAGMNSLGVMSSAGVGRVLADWMADGVPPMDLWEVDISRRDPRASAAAHMHERMQEAVADAFELHWPFKQPTAGRGLRTSVLHEKWREAGAVFGLTAGWERGLRYARSEEERALPYSVGEQAWQYIADREARDMAAGASLIDLSPFAKIDISGPDALSCGEQLCAGRLDVEIGRAVYTPMLNAKGGIEADVTVTRTAAQTFRITSGAATRWKDLAWIRRRSAGFDLAIDDRTEDEAVIGVMGPGSRDLLASLSDDNWDDFPFGTAASVGVAGKDLTATRVSFVGEFGWELSVANKDAEAVFDALRQRGAGVLGHYALDGCRMEKRFKHWGHDLGPEITPLEAGLGFTIGWSKPDFIGKDALARQKAEGIRRRLVLFELPDHPLILHDEPIWERDRVVGLTTSGAKGPRTGKTLAFGLVTVTPGESLSHSVTRQFEIEVAGRRYPALPLARPPYDPDGNRMRA
jgi:4-methylaminobutanoate oxidase (formaldehyde-forming)